MGMGELFLAERCCDPGMLWMTFPITRQLTVPCACVLGSGDLSTSISTPLLFPFNSRRRKILPGQQNFITGEWSEFHAEFYCSLSLYSC